MARTQLNPNPKGILRKARKALRNAGRDWRDVNMYDIGPENFVADELPRPGEPFTLWIQKLHAYVTI